MHLSVDANQPPERLRTTILVLPILLAFSSAPVWSDNRANSTPWKLSLDEVQARVNHVAPGRSLRPTSWPEGARVAVLFSFDVDNESRAVVEDMDQFATSGLQFGARRGIKRIVDLLDKHEIPATFFIPAVSLLLAPEMGDLIKRTGHHEIAVHGWIHERASDMSAEEQADTIRNSTKTLEEIIGVRPVGYRAPYGTTTKYTIPILLEEDFLYDSSFSADDLPYEILISGEPVELVEIPPNSTLMDNGTLQAYKDAFDIAYEESGMLVFLLHPHVSGRMSRIRVIEDFIQYALSRGSVWFATHEEMARYVLENKSKE